VKFRAHRLEIDEKTIQEKLEQFLNSLEGEVVAIVPHTTPTFQFMGATSKVNFLLIIEKVEPRR
jgi:hypothetical protein